MPEDPFVPQTPPPSTTPVVSPVGVPPVTGATSTGLAPNVAAGLAVLFGLISGIVFLVLEKRSALVRFWAMQSVVLNIATLAFAVVASILVTILSKIAGVLGLLFGLLVLVIYLGILALYVIALIQAFSGKEWEMPFIGKFARQQLLKFPPTP